MKPTVVYQPLSKIGYVHVTFACFIYSALHIVFVRGGQTRFLNFCQRNNLQKRGGPIGNYGFAADPEHWKALK